VELIENYTRQKAAATPSSQRDTFLECGGLDAAFAGCG